MKIQILNQKGFTHHFILPTLVVIAIAAVGVKVLTSSQAQTPSTITSQPAVAIAPNGTAYIFWKGADGNLWQSQGNPDGTMSAPNRRGFGPLYSPPAASVDADGSTFVFWQGTGPGYALWSAYWSGSQWVGPVYRGMGPMGSQPTVDVIGSGTNRAASVYWRGTDGGIWAAKGNPAVALGGPINYGMGVIDSAPTVCQSAVKKFSPNSIPSTSLEWAGSGGTRFWRGTAYPGTSHQGPYQDQITPYANKSTQPSCVSVPNPNQPVSSAVYYYRGADGNLHSNWEKTGNMGPLGSVPSAAYSPTTKKVYVYWAGTDGNVWGTSIASTGYDASSPKPASAYADAKLRVRSN